MKYLSKDQLLLLSKIMHVYTTVYFRELLDDREYVELAETIDSLVLNSSTLLTALEDFDDENGEDDGENDSEDDVDSDEEEDESDEETVSVPEHSSEIKCDQLNDFSPCLTSEGDEIEFASFFGTKGVVLEMWRNGSTSASNICYLSRNKSNLVVWYGTPEELKKTEYSLDKETYKKTDFFTLKSNRVYKVEFS